MASTAWIADPSLEAIKTVAARVCAASAAQTRTVAERRLARARGVYSEAEHYDRLIRAYAGAVAP